MVSISHVVKKIVEEQPLIYEGIVNNIINFPNLADQLKPKIEKELGSKVKESAIIMALRRLSEKIQSKEQVSSKFKFHSEIIMKTGLSDITLVKSPSLMKKLNKIYEAVDYEKGETLNIIQGNYEITIVVSEKHTNKIKSLLNDEKIINIEKDLVSLAMSFDKDFLYTPGILAKVTRKLHWENINIFENISTMTEVIFIVNKKDAMRAYNALQELIEEG